MVGYLEFADGRRVEVRDGITVGRVSSCDVEIDDAKVSRRHARFVVDRGVVEVEDLRSSNGTQLNGKPVERRIVRNGDVITIGRTDLVFHEQTVAEAPPTAAIEVPKPAEPVVEAAPPPPAPAADEDLLAGDLLDDDDFVDVPIAPPQVEAPPPPPPPKPAPPPKPRPAAKPAPPPKKPEAEASPRDRGVLQFSKRGSGGALFDDVGQTGGAQRLLILLAGVVVAVAAGFAVVQLVS